MKIRTHIPQKTIPRCLLLSVLILCSCLNTAAQQGRPAANRPKTRPPATSPTFDTLLSVNSYKVYGEVRGVGQLIRSNSVNDLLEPVMKLAAPPKEFSTLVKWLNKHADAVMTSRMLVAAWPTAKNVPSVLVAIEFGSAEEAERFEPQLNDFLPRVLPAPSPTLSAGPEEKQPTAAKQKPTPPPPSYYLSRAGSLIFITPTPLTLKNLRPAGSKLLSEDSNFRTARDRFGSEQLFVFVDFEGFQKEEEERAKQLEETAKKREAELATAKTEEPDVPEAMPSESATPPNEGPIETPAATPIQGTLSQTPESDQKSEQPPDPISMAFDLLGPALFNGQPKWPEALGIAVALDNESIDARVLMVNSPGVKSDVVPFFPLLIPGPSITPEAPTVFPGDTELLVTMSLDFGQMYAGVNKPSGPTVIGVAANEPENKPTLTTLENRLGIKIKDDLLPLLGSELVLGMPVTKSQTAGTPEDSKDKTPPKPREPAPVIALAVRDKAGMKVLLPKIIDSMGFKGASAFAQVDKRGDTEIVTYANALSYAFVGNFLVLSTDVGNTRHVVESYLKGETLSADSNFKNYTRWQPRQLQGQVYLSPALMDSYRTWVQEPTALISDQTREFLTRLTFMSQPVTYSLSNDGLGALHEIHVPKNLLLMLVASMSAETNPPPMLANERKALSAVYMIASAEAEFRAAKGNGTYGTIDQLLGEKDYLKTIIENPGYKIEVTVMGNHFEVSAVPIEYGKTGRMSYFTDETQVVRGGDRAGSPATVADKPVSQ